MGRSPADRGRARAAMRADRGIDGPRERPAAADGSDPRLHHMRGLTKTYDKQDRAGHLPARTIGPYGWPCCGRRATCSLATCSLMTVRL